MHDFNRVVQERLRQHVPGLLGLARLASTVAPILYLAGLWHWVYFFVGADLRSNDWRLTLDFQSVLRDALARGEIPYLASLAGHYTNQFLGLPETPLSPQYLLLPFFDDWTFNVLNICFLYTVCHAGLLLIRREFGLSPLPFALLYLLFNFNGYLVSRLGAGHSMWLGYFFLPFVHLFLLRLLAVPDSRRPAIFLVLTLVLIELQGSFHLYIWCLMYLGLIALFTPRFIKPVFFVCAWSFLLCAFRFLPAAVTWWGRSLDFMTGFPSPVMLLDGLTAIKDYKFTDTPFGLGWWEFDCYVDVIGLGLLLYFGVYRRLHSAIVSGHRYGELLWADATLLLLSMGFSYGLLASLPIPLLNSQRVPARFIIVPLTMLMILAAIHLQEFLAKRKPSPQARLFLWLSVIFLAKNLYEHSMVWRITNVEVYFWKEYMQPVKRALVVPVSSGDPGIALYTTTVKVSVVLSLIVLTAFVLWVFRSKPRRTR